MILYLVFGAILATAWRFDYFFNHSVHVTVTLLVAMALVGMKRYRASFCIGGAILAISSILQLHSGQLVLADFLLQNFVGTRTTIIILSTIIFTELVMDIDETKALKWCIFANLILTYGMRYFTGHWVGFFDNSAVNSCFIGIFFPYLKLWQMPFAFGILLADNSRTAWLMLSLYFPMIFFQYRSKNRYLVASALALVVSVFLWKSYTKNFILWDRWKMWEFAMTHWWENSNRLIGNGTGSFFVEIPRLQKQLNFWNGYYYTTAHNDFLQTLYETGIIGFLALLWVVGDSLFVAAKEMGRPFYVLTCFTIFAFFFFPLEMPSFLFFWLFFIQKTLRRQDRILIVASRQFGKNHRRTCGK